MKLRELNSEIERIEPSLDEVMRFCVGGSPEGFRLRNSVCGFASNVLSKYLRAKHVRDAGMKIGFAVDDPPPNFPDRMRWHVLVDSPTATIDPTWTQFMTLVGLDPVLAAQHEDLAKLYPARRVAVIPKGTERMFGERFADYALEQVTRVRDVRTKLGADARFWSTDDVCVWMPSEEAFEVLADIWNPERYERFDNEGDSEAQAQKAVTRLFELARNSA